MSWSFGDETGWMVGAGAFLAIALGVGWGVYVGSHRLFSMGSLDLGRPVSRRPSIVLGVLVGVSVFSSFYFTALSGFTRLDYRDGQLIMGYILPAHTVSVSFLEVMNVQEKPTYKGRWRLVLITDIHGSYESALSWQADVHQVAEWLRREMRQPSLTPR